MKVNITKKEYEHLMHVFYISDWIMNAFSIETRTDTKAYRDLEQKFLLLAKYFGLDDLVDKEKDGKVLPSRKFEDESPAMKFIEEFEEEVFWDELIERLAKRDFIEEHGEGSLRKLFENEELFSSLEETKERYQMEFEVNGLERLRIK